MNENVKEIIKQEEIDSETIVKLSKVYKFEGKEISQLDSAGLDDLTVEDLVWAQKVINADGGFTLLAETDTGFCMNIASRGFTVEGKKLPVEFYTKTLSAKDGVKIKNKVINYFFAEE